MKVKPLQGALDLLCECRSVLTIIEDSNRILSGEQSKYLDWLRLNYVVVTNSLENKSIFFSDWCWFGSGQWHDDLWKRRRRQTDWPDGRKTSIFTPFSCEAVHDQY